MFKRLATTVAACFYYSGLVRLARRWTQRRGQCLIILNYHRAAGGDLRRHLLYLKRHYRILHLEAALEELYTPHQREKEVCDRRTPLVLTFDDGYHDNYTHGFALARELQIPITIFLIAGYVESGGHFWWRESERLVYNTQVDEATIAGRIYHLRRPQERNALAQAIDAHARYAPSVAEREAFLATARTLLMPPVAVAAGDAPTSPLGWPQAREMEESGLVSIGAHTVHHPILAYLADAAEVQFEVGACRRMLEQQLGHAVRTFAYPVGQPEHIGEEALRAVQEAGYEWALTTVAGFNNARSDRYLLRRIEVDVSQHWLVLAAKSAGLWGLLFHLRNRLRKLRR